MDGTISFMEEDEAYALPPIGVYDQGLQNVSTALESGVRPTTSRDSHALPGRGADLAVSATPMSCSSTPPQSSYALPAIGVYSYSLPMIGVTAPHNAPAPDSHPTIIDGELTDAYAASGPGIGDYDGAYALPMIGIDPPDGAQPASGGLPILPPQHPSPISNASPQLPVIGLGVHVNSSADDAVMSVPTAEVQLTSADIDDFMGELPAIGLQFDAVRSATCSTAKRLQAYFDGGDIDHRMSSPGRYSGGGSPRSGANSCVTGVCCCPTRYTWTRHI